MIEDNGVKDGVHKATRVEKKDGSCSDLYAHHSFSACDINVGFMTTLCLGSYRLPIHMGAVLT